MFSPVRKTVIEYKTTRCLPISIKEHSCMQAVGMVDDHIVGCPCKAGK